MDKRLYELVKYPFSDDELRVLGENLAHENQSAIDLKEQRSASVASFAAQLKAAQERIADLTQKITHRYELREVECVALLDDPRPGMKRIARIDDLQQTIRTEPMTQAEMQTSFGFREEEPPDGKTKGAGK